MPSGGAVEDMGTAMRRLAIGAAGVLFLMWLGGVILQRTDPEGVAGRAATATPVPTATRAPLTATSVPRSTNTPVPQPTATTAPDELFNQRFEAGAGCAELFAIRNSVLPTSRRAEMNNKLASVGCLGP